MNISHTWLQEFFDEPIPSAQEIADALTFHAFEIEGIEEVEGDTILDVKITPNRGHDCLSHRGVAKEIAAIFSKKLKHDPFATTVELTPTTNHVKVAVEDATLCPRYISCYIRGVKVGPSPKWLVERLEAIGQRSVNNVVDATNYVMFNIGQPLHAFDAARLHKKDHGYAIGVRRSHDGEDLDALDGKVYTLNASMLAIADMHTGKAIGIAGVKGGTAASITEETTDIILESANFNGPMVRKTGQQLKLRTDASQRFEQVISPEVAAHGIREVADLIVKLAGGTIEGFVDVYPEPQQPKTVSVTASLINRVLGTELSNETIGDVFARLGFSYEEHDGTFAIAVPFERLDIDIPEDLAEEVVRIVGYEAIGTEDLPPATVVPAINQRFYAAERIHEYLVLQGFSEVLTTTFADKGERVVLNKVDGVKPYLREELSGNLADVLERNIKNKDLLGLAQVKIFEIGSVWKGGVEKVMLGLAVEQKKKTKNASEYLTDLIAHLGERLDTSLQAAHVLEIDIDKVTQAIPTGEHYEQLPTVEEARYKPFSRYPFITRDIAMWTPSGTHADDIFSVIHAHAGSLLVRADLFDRFEKEGRVSFAFRLVFQSFDRTLQNEDADERMQSITTSLTDKEFEVR